MKVKGLGIFLLLLISSLSIDILMDILMGIPLKKATNQMVEAILHMNLSELIVLIILFLLTILHSMFRFQTISNQSHNE
ncbi:hypothetical protein [Tepidibacillus decaturensis]|uniref:hypothetical protein n=1 Tax=Tepidibacillus decaturensis TaxID=1413211 RepID=UPI0008571662|nr:hypothetical protein [Tepidibacillus decaturensis]GBF11743.1 hypothetical protein HK1_01782 [Tepidibacillus sp. HK-1]